MPSQLTSWWHQCPLLKGHDLWSLARPQSLHRAVWSGVIWSHCLVCREMSTPTLLFMLLLCLWCDDITSKKPSPVKHNKPCLYKKTLPTCAENTVNTFLLKSGHGYNMALRKRNYTFSSYLWAYRPTCFFRSACGWFWMRAVKRRQNIISQEMFKR